MSIEPQNFRVDLGGVIDLLSRNLYSTPGVYLRELLQNCVDAIAARGALGAGEAPRLITVSPFGVDSADSSAAEFSITDAGIGIGPEEVTELLATVGASSKREAVARSRGTYLGQFGVGLLSCFLVADEITVTTRRATGEQPLMWTGRRREPAQQGARR